MSDIEIIGAKQNNLKIFILMNLQQDFMKTIYLFSLNALII